MNIVQILKKYKRKSGESGTIRYGNLNIYFKREELGWWIKSYEGDPDEKNKGNFYQTGTSDTLIFAPVLPSKPIVFKGNGINLALKQTLTFFIKIPLNVEIYHTQKSPENKIYDIVPTRLSDTWFGEPDKGEPALSIGSGFFLNPDEADPGISECLCPITVTNNSDILLELERLIIRIENLSLFLVNDKVLTSSVILDYKGKDAVSSASYLTSENIHGDKPLELAKPMVEKPDNLLKINFHFIKNIYRNT